MGAFVLGYSTSDWLEARKALTEQLGSIMGENFPDQIFLPLCIWDPLYGYLKIPFIGPVNLSVPAKETLSLKRQSLGMKWMDSGHAVLTTYLAVRKESEWGLTLVGSTARRGLLTLLP